MRNIVRLCCALCAALLLNIALSATQFASAATFNVNNTGDSSDIVPGNGACADSSGACTLRAAIQEANAFFGNDTITISATGTINLTGALPDITSNITLNGPGSSLLTVRRDTGGDYRIFFTNNVNVNISGMTITNGKTPDGTSGTGESARPGGGIWQAGGIMMLTDVVIAGNRTGNGGSGSGSSTGGRGGDAGGLAASGTLTMTNVVVSNNATGNGAIGYYGGSGGFGGGMSFGGNTLTMTNVVITGNTTGNAGETTSGGLGGNGGSGGGIYAGSGTLNMSNVTISGNSAGNGDDGGHGGGMFILPDATTTMRNSTISNNITGMGSSKFGAQGGWGGGIVNHGQMLMEGCVVSGNSTKNSLWGSGGGSLGGGIFNGNTLKMTNSTVSGNRADPLVGRGGGIYNNANALTLTNVTITGNSAYTCCTFQNGQGIHNRGVTNVSNSIIADNGGGKTPSEWGQPVPDVTGTYNSLGHNIIGRAHSTDASTDTSSSQSGFKHGVNGDQVGTPTEPINPQLGPLASNGGLTQTHATLAGSPALDKGNNSLAVDANNNLLATDQRGSGRFADSGGTGAAAKVDIGSYEFHPFLENVTDKETKEDGQLFLLFNIGEADINPSSITATSGNQALVADANLSITGAGSIRTLRITPSANQTGVVTINLTVNGSNGVVKSDSFQLTVTPVNDAPTFTIGPDQIISEDAGTVTVNNWATNLSVGPNESGQSLTFVMGIHSITPGLMFSTPPTISPSGALTYALAPNSNGSAVLTVSLKDDGGTANGGQDTSGAQTFNLTVMPVNDPPVAADNSYGLNEDTVVSRFAPGILGNDTDIDGNLITPELVSGPNNGSVTLRDDGSFLYTPKPNFNGPDFFTYRVSDGTDWSNVAHVSFNVFVVNDAPVNTVPIARQIAGTTPLIFSAANSNLISVADVDAGNNPLSVTISASNGTLTLKTTSGLSFNTGDGTADSIMTFVGNLSYINAALDGLSYTPRANFSGQGNIQIVTNDLANTGPIAQSDTDLINITILPGGVLQFSTTNYQFSEGTARAVINISRTGDSTGPVSVDFATVDDPSAVPCDPTVRRADDTPYPRGLAYARCDYATTIGTVTFASGDFQTKTINVPLIDDAHDEGLETVQLRLFNPTGALLGTLSTATLNIIDNNDAGVVANPILSTPLFVRMQYLDFLSREPEAGEPWSGVLIRCPNVFNDTSCDRILVSQSFFGSPEFRLKGFYAFNFYRVAFDRRPTYEEIIPDMRSVTGATEQEVYQKRAAFALRFTDREEFKGVFNALTDTAFVDTLLNRYALQHITTPDPASPEGAAKIVLTRADLISRLGASGAQALTRAQVLRAIVESNEVGVAEYNRAFVAMQYYGYLRRTPEEDGYQAWLKVINHDPNNIRIMVDGFMNSTEYKLRFGRAQ